jgi:hypothetical protein
MPYISKKIKNLPTMISLSTSITTFFSTFKEVSAKRLYEYDSQGEKVYFCKEITCGILNYIITKIILAYLETKGKSYQTCNDIIGVLDNVKHEFRRRVQDGYEEEKIKQNGDVY